MATAQPAEPGEPAGPTCLMVSLQLSNLQSSDLEILLYSAARYNVTLSLEKPSNYSNKYIFTFYI